MASVPKGRRNVAENFNRLSRVHEHLQTYRQPDRRQTFERRHIANVNVSSRSLKSGLDNDKGRYHTLNSLDLQMLIISVANHSALKRTIISRDDVQFLCKFEENVIA